LSLSVQRGPTARLAQSLRHADKQRNSGLRLFSSISKSQTWCMVGISLPKMQQMALPPFLRTRRITGLGLADTWRAGCGLDEERDGHAARHAPP
jgi:hypothetical protein